MGRMSDSQGRPDPEPGTETDDGARDLADHERPEVGLIGDEDLPEDLQPTDDNPLAKDPDESADQDDDEAGNRRRAEGVPDMGDPGAPA